MGSLMTSRREERAWESEKEDNRSEGVSYADVCKQNSVK